MVQHIRFYCKICNKTLSFQMDDQMIADLKAKADRWPYPVIVPHSDHWVVIYLDADMKDRSVVPTSVMLKKID